MLESRHEHCQMEALPNATGAFDEQRRYKKGYNTSHLPKWVVEEIKACDHPDIVLSATEGVLTVLSIPAIAALALWAISGVNQLSAPSWLAACASLTVYLLASITIARQQRGLELMVHDASHRAWHRKDPKLNDFVANLIVAYPMLSSIEAYWQSHRVHHGAYGGQGDPCKRRFKAMGLGTIDLSTRRKIALAVLRWLPDYNMAYYQEIGSITHKHWAIFWLWHMVILIVPATVAARSMMDVNMFQALAVGLSLWVVFWMLPALMILPVIRSIAEAEEHDYDLGGTEFETTFTNAGIIHRMLIHPKNDAFHLIHHMFPNVPERTHRRIHELLLRHDSQYQAGLHRTRILRRG